MQQQHSDNLTTLWQSLADDLRSFFRRRLTDDALVDDLLQETFLRLHRNRQQLDDVQRMEAWIFRIARNLLTDHYRRRERSRMETGAPAGEFADDEQREPVENENQQIGKWLQAAIEFLPPTYRDAIRMYEIESLSQREIADRLNLSLTATKSRIQRGRAKLKSLLDDCCSLEFDSHGNILDYQQRGPKHRICCDDKKPQ